jgi:hypothetical protein
MPFLENIVESINSKIKDGPLKCFPANKVMTYGITESILDASNQEGQRPIRYPITVDDKGEGRQVAVNDLFDITIYHKLESITTTLDPRKGFGDSHGTFFEIANLAMMVLAFRDKTGKTASWLEMAIKDSMPNIYRLVDKQDRKLQDSFLQPTQSNFDKPSLLSREYSDVVLNYPSLVVFEIRYRIESNYQQGCFHCNCA